jgi:hypothetical protein
MEVHVFLALNGDEWSDWEKSPWYPLNKRLGGIDP